MDLEEATKELQKYTFSLNTSKISKKNNLTRKVFQRDSGRIGKNK